MPSKHYYYDDCGADGDNWTDLGTLPSNKEAIKKGEELQKRYRVKPAPKLVWARASFLSLQALFKGV